MPPQSRAAVVLGILFLAGIPALVVTHAMLVQGSIRIVDPMVGAPQFCQLNGSFPVTVEAGGAVDPGSWQASLHSIDFAWIPPFPLELDSILVSTGSRHVLTVTLPPGIIPGLYDVNVSCTIAGTAVSAEEPHAVSIYDETSSFHFAHLTDPHVSFPDTNVTMNLAPPHEPVVLGVRTVNENLGALFSSIAVIRPDFIILTGDLATRGLEEEFQAVRELIKGTSIPVLCTLGNHDHRSPPTYTHYLGPAYYSRSIGNLRVVCLDTGASEGNGLFGEQLAWFEGELGIATSRGQQVIVAMHIPSTTEPLGGYTIAGNAKFRALCLQHGVRGIFTGHHHYSDAEYANGSQVTTPDPIPPSAGPIYIKTGSTTLDYGNGDRGLGWRYVHLAADGSMSIGYDVAGGGTSDPIEDAPLNGLVRDGNSTAIDLFNYLRLDFVNITVPMTLDISEPEDLFVPSEGTIFSEYRSDTSLAVLLQVTLPSRSKLTITFSGM